MKTDDIANTVYVAARIILLNSSEDGMQSQIMYKPNMSADIDRNIGLISAFSRLTGMSHLNIKRAFGAIIFKVFDACRE